MKVYPIAEKEILFKYSNPIQLITVANRSFLTRLLLFFNVLAAIALMGAYVSTYISPHTFWPIAFFGLAHPALLALNLLFVVWWLCRRARKKALISLVIIVFGITHLPNFFQLSSSRIASSAENTQLKVLSYNVRLFDYYSWSDNKTTRNKIFSFLKGEDPDIICFQEFYHTDLEGVFETKDILVTFLRAKNIHEKYRYVSRAKQHFGIATFSAYPIINRGEIDFEGDLVNHCIYCDIKVNGDVIRVYNAHLASIQFSREDYEFIENLQVQGLIYRGRQIGGRLKRAFMRRATQTEKIVAHVATSPYPVIVCGDFNDTPVSYCYRQFSSLLTDAFKESSNGIGNTYVGAFPSFRIDYIFHSSELHSYQFETHSEKLSDHYPISCVVEVE